MDAGIYLAVRKAQTEAQKLPTECVKGNARKEILLAGDKVKSAKVEEVALLCVTPRTEICCDQDTDYIVLETGRFFKASPSCNDSKVVNNTDKSVLLITIKHAAHQSND